MADPLNEGPFQLVRRLAVGGMGEVLLARTEGDARVGLGEGLVVIKRTLPKHPNLDHQNRMLKEEGRIALRLRHANLVETFALDEIEETPILIMEYLAGRSMAQVLGAAKRMGQMVPVDVALKIIHESACGLHFAHTLKEGERLAGLVHRDVSPANIFVTFDGRVKVIDFGVAKADDSEIKTSTGILKGKIGYMSPEHTLGERLDPRSDLWSLGVLLWETLIAERLFASQNPALTLHKINNADIARPIDRRPDIPKSVDNLVMRLLARAKDERVGSGAELVRLIAGITDVPWETADLGAFLMERFPEEAARGQSEAAQAAKARAAPVPQGLITGSFGDDIDELEAATIVANSRDLIEMARQITGSAGLDDEDEARTVQLSAAEVAELTKGRLPAPPAANGREQATQKTAPQYGNPSRSEPTLPAVVDLPTDEAPTIAKNIDELLGTAEETFAPTSPDNQLTTDARSAPKHRTQAPSRGVGTRPARTHSDQHRAAARAADPSAPHGAARGNTRESGAHRREDVSSSHASSRARRRRRGPSATAVALGTFGLLATAMGLLFGALQPAREPTVVAWSQTKTGPETISAWIDVPTDPPPKRQRRLDLNEPRIVLEKSRGARFVKPADLSAKLQQSGVWARANLPHTARGRFAAALPPLFIILGLMALAWAVPSFLLTGTAIWIVRAALFAGTLAVCGAGLFGGLLGWPGLKRLSSPAAHIEGKSLQLRPLGTDVDGNQKNP